MSKVILFLKSYCPRIDLVTSKPCMVQWFAGFGAFKAMWFWDVTFSPAGETKQALIRNFSSVFGASHKKRFFTTF